MTFAQDIIRDNFRLILLFVTFFGVTGGFGYIGTAYFSSAEMFGLINSLILQAKVIVGIYR